RPGAARIGRRGGLQGSTVASGGGLWIGVEELVRVSRGIPRGARGQQDSAVTVALKDLEPVAAPALPNAFAGGLVEVLLEQHAHVELAERTLLEQSPFWPQEGGQIGHGQVDRDFA